MKLTDLIPRRQSEVLGEPPYPLYNLQREVNRLFEEFPRVFDLPVFWHEGQAFQPVVDVIETETELQVVAELPGMKQDELDVTLQNDVLTIRGEKKTEREEKTEHYYHRERRYGAFARSIPLPTGVTDENKVVATFENGVLTIKLPKRPEAQTISKQIPISVN